MSTTITEATDTMRAKDVSRLRNSRRLKAEADKHEGRQRCKMWMAESEDEDCDLLAIQVESLKKAKQHLGNHGSDCIADLVASYALEYDGTPDDTDKDYFWKEVAAMPLDDVSDAFAEGFLEEAIEIATEAD